MKRSIPVLLMLVALTQSAPASADLLNVWHIPTNEEPPTVTMRNPVQVSADDTMIFIYAGGHPIGTIWFGTLHFRQAGEPSWSTQDFIWDSNQDPNEYFRTDLVNVWAAGDQMEYYIELEGAPGADITFVYGDDSSSNTSALEVDAQSAPYQFTLIGAGTPTASPTVTPTTSGTPQDTPTPTPSGTPGDLMTVWHVPSNPEPPSVHMRHPLAPQAGDEIQLFVGGWPIPTIWELWLAYRINGGPWNEIQGEWDSNDDPNEYFKASLVGGLVSGDDLDYYLWTVNPSFATTFLYGSDSECLLTASEATAMSAPFQVAIGGPTATPTPHATARPTSTPTGGATATPTPTPTPTGGFHGVEMLLPTLMVHPGDDFWVQAELHNPGAAATGVPLVVVLDVLGDYWFWPTWRRYDPPDQPEIDFRNVDVPNGSDSLSILSTITWPDTGQDALDGIYFHGAMLEPSMTALWGELGSIRWGYGPG